MIADCQRIHTGRQRRGKCIEGTLGSVNQILGCDAPVSRSFDSDTYLVHKFRGPGLIIGVVALCQRRHLVRAGHRSRIMNENLITLHIMTRGQVLVHSNSSGCDGC